MVITGYKVQGSYHIKDVFYYYFMAYSSHSPGFYNFAQVVGFDELEPGEATDLDEIELAKAVGTEVVVDIGTMVAGIKKQQCKDMDSMAWEPYKLEIGGGHSP